MRLYNANLSPFASRCRIQIYAKGLDVELAPPPGGPSSDAYKKINPTGRVPALEADGAVLPESEVICEYLEERFPKPALRPGDPLGRARVRLLSRLLDADVVPPLVRLFGQLDPKARDARVVTEGLEALRSAYDRLERFLDDRGPFAAGPELTLADCALYPFFFFATRIHPVLGDKSPLEGRPKLAAWYEAAKQHPAVARVDQELEKALGIYMSGGGAT